nr:immunoglobulin light chain junction region [Macaca mulatta]MPO03370.1 immunoglobulin light chain junction region [Macaca mulatta]MPO03447.1 immunoglobulin light chain junction region [Macaca mulatta]MPO03601.1 immunoglobulin light chain junction region [Macaca mulatta]MPO04064.1 immunoglobulin light chain junction region [Macaca mulatta]
CQVYDSSAHVLF